MSSLEIDWLFALVLVTSASSPQAVETGANRLQQPDSSTEPEDPALAEVRELLEAARGAREASDYAGARDLVLAAVERGFALLGERDDEESTILFEELGEFAHDAGELAVAERVRTAVVETWARTLPDDHDDLQRARLNLATTMEALGDLAGARALDEAVLEVWTRTLPEDDLDLQLVRGNLAVTLRVLGDLEGARALEEVVLEVRSRTQPEDHPDIQVARGNLAVTLRVLGDLDRALELEEAVLESCARTLPEDHLHLQAARLNLAVTMAELGDLDGARALEEAALAVFERTLPEDHPDLQLARQNLAGTMARLGDLQGALTLFEAVLEVRARTLPEDHPDLQRARGNVALTIKALGDLSRALALEETVLEVFARTLPDDHPDLQTARLNLASTMRLLGDLHAARGHFEAVLEVCERTLPEDHPYLQGVRQNLAVTSSALGDLAGARALEEAVLEFRARTLPEDHPDLQAARQNLAVTLGNLGDHVGARALEEEVLEVFARTLPADHHDLQRARLNLAATIAELGDLAGARALEEAVLEVRMRLLPEDHPDLRTARENLAVAMAELGDLEGALALEETVLEGCVRTLPEDHPDLQTARKNLAVIIARQCARASRGARGTESGSTRCTELIGASCRSQVRAARDALLTSSVRAAEESCAQLAKLLDTAISFAVGYGVFGPLEEVAQESFILSETTRGAALASAAIHRRAAGAPDYVRLRGELHEASETLAGLAQSGTTSEEFHRARTEREGIERELIAVARELTGGSTGLDFDAAMLGERLGESDAVVAFRRYARWSIRTDVPSMRAESVPSLCAFVLRRGAARHADPSNAESLVLVPLGELGAIEDAVRAWRKAIGAELERVAAVSGAASGEVRGVGVSSATASDAHVHGEALRRLVWDPLLSTLGDAQRVIVALDEVLHLVPIEALPIGPANGEGGRELVGDRWRIETRVTLAELLGEELPSARDGVLVALGGASFHSEPAELAEPDVAVLDEGYRESEGIGLLRGGAWERGFGPLTYTGLEAREIAALHDEVFTSGKGAFVLERRKASRAALEALAPRAGFLHIATHGWFAPESVRSWSDVGPLDVKSGLGLRLSGDRAVRGMSPMLLCGLALAGANLPEDELGRVPGLVTAEELSTLDLSHCELAVLSACDTNVGERRAGQGVASLQKALQMAGARSVITSLWKVPDEATRELMLDFYRRIWVEKKPKAQALWEAKQKMRAAVDERGEPRYTTRDWAAWVLTGSPD